MNQLQKPEILFVEDNKIELELLRRLSRKAGIEDISNFAPDAETALEHLCALPSIHGTAPRIMVTDINMPGMNGHDLIDQVRAIPKIARTPVFIMSTSDSRIDIAKGYEKKIMGYVVKDLSGDAIRELLLCVRHFRNAISYGQH